MKKLLEVQKQIGTLTKDSKNPFFKSQYLDLTTLLQHVTPLLNKQGLLIIQPLDNNTVTTGIIDSESGNVIASSSLTLPDIKDPQKLGSAITYFRRYTLKSLLAIAEEDDDGNKASKPEPKKELKTIQKSKLEDSLLNGSIEELRSLFKEYNLSKEEQEQITERAKFLKTEIKNK